MIAEWRGLAGSRIAPLFETERERWLRDLHWDYAPTLADIERARAAGQLPGLVMIDRDHVSGWAYYLLHGSELQIGGIVSASVDASRRLLDAILNSAEGQQARSRMAFGYFDAPGIDELLPQFGFTTERYSYQELSLADFTGGTDGGSQPFDLAHTSAAARLLQHAYAGEGAMRPFARSGSSDEWLGYVAQLIATNGCGQFASALSVVDGRTDELTAAALVTRISDRVAHLAQLAVDPGARGSRRGRAVLGDVCVKAKRQGCDRLTLLVRSSNAAAQRLYSSFGFTERASFLLGVS